MFGGTTVSIAPEDEEHARALLIAYVADIDATADLIDRVEAEGRRRRVARRFVLPVTALAAAASVAVFVPALGRIGNSPDGAESGRSVITCQSSLPSSWWVLGLPPTGAVPGSARSLVPGRPVADVSCPLGGNTRTVELSEQELVATVAALNSAAPSMKTPGGLCETKAQRYETLYLVFEYDDGTKLTVFAHPMVACNFLGQVTWYATNSVTGGTIHSTALDALATSIDSATPAH